MSRQNPQQAGWVYVITNPAMPHLVKVGLTSKTPEERAKELKATGVPYAHQVRYKMRCYQFAQIEKQAHAILSEYRADKEWFECSVETAIAAIRQAAGKNKISEEIVRDTPAYSSVSVSKSVSKNNPNKPHSATKSIKKRRLPWLNKIIASLFVLLLLGLSGLYFYFTSNTFVLGAPQHELALEKAWQTLSPDIQNMLAEDRVQWHQKTERLCQKNPTQHQQQACFSRETEKYIQYLQGYSISSPR